MNFFPTLLWISSLIVIPTAFGMKCDQLRGDQCKGECVYNRYQTTANSHIMQCEKKIENCRERPLWNGILDIKVVIFIDSRFAATQRGRKAYAKNLIRMANELTEKEGRFRFVVEDRHYIDLIDGNCITFGQNDSAAYIHQNLEEIASQYRGYFLHYITSCKFGVGGAAIAETNPVPCTPHTKPATSWCTVQKKANPGPKDGPTCMIHEIAHMLKVPHSDYGLMKAGGSTELDYKWFDCPSKRILFDNIKRGLDAGHSCFAQGGASVRRRLVR